MEFYLIKTKIIQSKCAIIFFQLSLLYRQDAIDKETCQEKNN